MDTKTIMGITIAVLVIALIVTNTPSIGVNKLRAKLNRKCDRKRNKDKNACKGISGVVGPDPGAGGGGRRASRSGLL